MITPEQSEFGAKVCGPGKFMFSPMQCAGDKFEYKSTTLEALVEVSGAGSATEMV